MTPMMRANRSATRGLAPDSEADNTTTHQSARRASNTRGALVEGEEVVIGPLHHRLRLALRGTRRALGRTSPATFRTRLR